MRWIGLVFAGLHVLDALLLVVLWAGGVSDDVVPGWMLNTLIFLALLSAATYCLAVFAQRSSTQTLVIFLYAVTFLGAGVVKLHAIWSGGGQAAGQLPQLLSAILTIGIGLGLMAFNASARAIVLAFAGIRMALMLIVILFLGSLSSEWISVGLIELLAVIWFLSLPWVREQFGVGSA